MSHQFCFECGAPRDARGECPRCLLTIGLADGEMQDLLPPVADLAPDALPGYRLLEMVGRGGMGAVWRARQNKLDRIVAIKVLSSALDSTPRFHERFQQEARTMAALAHPNVVAVHDSGDEEGVCYLVMELVDGATLRDVMADEPLGVDLALEIVAQVADGLDYAHEEGVVHRDIKPENVLLDGRGRVKITDFGLAKLVDPARQAALTASRLVMGTPHYMAPEQVNRPKEVDRRADVYAAGVLLYEMLTGEVPVGRFATPSSRGRGDADIDRIVLKALEHDPELRFQRAAELRDELRAVLLRRRSGQPAPVRPAAVPSPVSEERAGQPQVHFELLLALVGILLTFLLWEKKGTFYGQYSSGRLGIVTLGGALIVLGLSLPWLVAASRRFVISSARLHPWVLLGSALAGAGVTVSLVRMDIRLGGGNPGPALGVLGVSAVLFIVASRTPLSWAFRWVMAWHGLPGTTRILRATAGSAAGLAAMTVMLPWYRPHFMAPVDGFQMPAALWGAVVAAALAGFALSVRRREPSGGQGVAMGLLGLASIMAFAWASHEAPGEILPGYALGLVLSGLSVLAALAFVACMVLGALRRRGDGAA